MRTVLRTLVCASTVVLAVLGLSAAPARAIVGGTLEDPADFPYFVHLSTTSANRWCGGSVIAVGWVLTAAHCVKDDADANTPGHLTVYQPRFTGSGPSSPAAAIFPHELFDGVMGHGHDVALVRLANHDLDAVPPVQIGAPWNPGVYAPGTEATIMGTGKTSPTSGYSINLLAADTPIHSDAYMRGTLSDWNDNDTLLIGAGAGATHQTTCDGDSGGPLVVGRTSPQPVQVGVDSFADIHCDRAAAFSEPAGPQLAWIASKVPTIMNRWGPCTAPDGRPGYNEAAWGPNYSPGFQPDGPYYWRIWCWTPTTVVPDLHGYIRMAATAALQAVGLTLGSVGVAVDQTCTYLNTVMRQNPSAGALVPPGSAVSITLGGRPRILPLSGPCTAQALYRGARACQGHRAQPSPELPARSPRTAAGQVLAVTASLMRLNPARTRSATS
jgi:trypsin